jgi:hypothetical protein
MPQKTIAKFITMEDEIVVHLRIKKQYAVALIEDLILAEAVEPVKDPEGEIPEWQKEAVRQTLTNVKQHPELLKSWESIKSKYKK